MKKLLSIVMSIVILLSTMNLFCIVANAAAKDDAYTCGDCVRYARERVREYWGINLHSPGDSYNPGGFKQGAKGYYFNVDLWDGTDIFHVRPNFILITSRLAELLIKHKVSGISVAKLTDYGDWQKGKRIL